LAYVFFIEAGTTPFIARMVYAAICVFVPLNIAFYTALRERGVLNVPGLRRISLPFVEIAFSAAIVLSQATEVTDALYRPFYEDSALAGVYLPQASIACCIAAMAVGVVCAVMRGSVLDAAFAAAIALFAMACNNAASPGSYAWFCTMAGAIIAIAVVQDSSRMAFYDELTGLAGRRALNDRMAALDGQFTVAMIDIDHFKVFNDTWGHDVGDQVLKLVAARLQRLGGGGKAYRYGGEEFCLIFPGQRAINLRYRLEALRKEIETYKLVVRESDPRTMLHSTTKPAETFTNYKMISVTVSIGVAERSNRLEAAGLALKAADKALYHAKSEGRNKVAVAPR
jgi:diguanylate cyclase (GGDEF)-like protein